MGPGLLFALTLPGLVVLLIALAVVEKALSRRKKASVMTGTHRSGLSAAGLDVFSTALMPGKENELEERKNQTLRRSTDADGAPPTSRVDLDRGVAHIITSGDDPKGQPPRMS